MKRPVATLSDVEVCRLLFVYEVVPLVQAGFHSWEIDRLRFWRWLVQEGRVRR